MFKHRMTYGKIAEGDLIFLDEDGTEIKKSFFGIFKKEVSRKALYKVVAIKWDGVKLMRIQLEKANTGEVRVIRVVSYWRARIHQRKSHAFS